MPVSVVIAALAAVRVVTLTDPAPNCEIDALVAVNRVAVKSVTVEDVNVKLLIVALVAVKLVTVQLSPVSVVIAPTVADSVPDAPMFPYPRLEPFRFVMNPLALPREVT